MSDQSKSAASTARAVGALHHGVVEADLRRRQEGRRRAAGRRDRRSPSSMARRTASSASGACGSISRMPTSARKQNIPAFQRQPSAISPAARTASGFSTKRATACAPPADRLAAGDVAVGAWRARSGRSRARRSARPRRARPPATAAPRMPRRPGSDGRTAPPGRSPSGSRRAARQAASVTAARVSRALRLQRDLDLQRRASAAWSATRNRDVRGADHDRRRRRARRSAASSVRWNGEAPPRIGTCCLAKSFRDTGQSREPDPPQRIAGTMSPARLSVTGPTGVSAVISNTSSSRSICRAGG